MADNTPAVQHEVESQNSEDSVTAAEYISSQLELEQEAREVLPYSFDSCTYPMGSLRQPIYSCRNHSNSAICYSCSISCHSECELVELFQKRNVQCDCGTTRMADFKCTLRKVKGEEPAPANHYCHNYEGRFCACDTLYDANKEKGTMFQCLLGDACNEDWFHDSCIMGEEPLSPVANEEKKIGADGEEEDGEGEPPKYPGFPGEDEFEHFICWMCVEKNPWLKRYANAPGFLKAIIRNKKDLGREDKSMELTEKSEGENPEALKEETVGDSRGLKRKSLDTMEEEVASKRTKTEISSSKATVATSETRVDADTEKETTVESATISTIETVEIKASTAPAASAPCKLPPLTVPENAQLSLFLLAPFRSHLCHCKSCFPYLAPHRVLLEEEQSYSPPMSEADSADGNSSQHSLLERGERALSAMDRVKAIEGVMAYNHLKEKVTAFLKPFAENRKQVSAEDVKAYFEALRNDMIPKKMNETGINASNGNGSNGDVRKEQEGA